MVDLPRVRGILIAVVLLGWCVLGLPVPVGLDEDDLQSTRGQAELARWVDTLASLGVQTNPKELGAAVLTVSNPLIEARRIVLRPIRPVTKQLGLNQRWALYASPPADPMVLVIEGQGPQGWRTLHRTLSSEYDWRTYQLRYRRLRGVWSTLDRKGGQTFVAFCDWVAERAFEDFPELVRIRVRVLRRRTALPGEAGGGEETLVRQRKVSR